MLMAGILTPGEKRLYHLIKKVKYYFHLVIT